MKSSVSDATKRAHDFLSRLRNDDDHNNCDRVVLDSDLASLESNWIAFKELLTRLGRRARTCNGFRCSKEVALFYTSSPSRHASSVSNSPISDKRVIDLRDDVSGSLLKEKGRRWFPKLSIAYRVHIKSRVKLRYRSRNASRDTSFTLSDWNTTNSSLLSLDTSNNHSFAAQHSPLAKNVSNTSAPQERDVCDIVRDLRMRVPCEEQQPEVNDFNHSNSTSDCEELSNLHCRSVAADVTSSSCESLFSTRDLESEFEHRREEPLSSASDNTSNNNLSISLQQQNQLEHPFGMETPKRRHGSTGSGSATPRSSPKLRASPCQAEEDSPISFKRRRVSSSSDGDDVIAPASPIESPIPGDASSSWFSPIVGKPEVESASPEVARQDLSSPPSRRQLSFENMVVTSSTPSVASSGMTTPTDSPYGTVDFRRKYRKDELWAAIQDDYRYLMGDDIIETCKVSVTSLRKCCFIESSSTLLCCRSLVIVLQLLKGSIMYRVFLSRKLR